MQKPISVLIDELKMLAQEYGATLSDEGHAIHAAKFAQVIGMQDKKMNLHEKLFDTLETLKETPKTEAQKDEIRNIVMMMSTRAQDNKQSIEYGFAALERLSGRIMNAIRAASQKTAPAYTAAGVYKNTRNQASTLHADRTA